MGYIENGNWVERLFMWVANILIRTAALTGLTYNEVNIICYYLLIPLSWTILFDIYIQRPYTTILLSLVWLGIIISKRNSFRVWCN